MESFRIPNNLRSYRRCYAYSQKKVARVLGLADTSMLSRWENGLAMPGVVQLFRLAKLYQTGPQQLYEKLWNELEPKESLASETEDSIY